MLKVISIIAVLCPMLAKAQSLEGQWLSEEREGVRSVIEVVPCQEGLCGTIVETRGGNPAEDVIDHQIFWGFGLKDDGSYTQGKLKPPGGAPQLNARITNLSEDEITLRACLLLVCRNQTMTRL